MAELPALVDPDIHTVQTKREHHEQSNWPQNPQLQGWILRSPKTPTPPANQHPALTGSKASMPSLIYLKWYSRKKLPLPLKAHYFFPLPTIRIQ